MIKTLKYCMALCLYALAAQAMDDADAGIRFDLRRDVKYGHGDFSLEGDEGAVFTPPQRPSKKRTQAVMVYRGRPEALIRETVLSTRDGRVQVSETERWPHCIHGKMSMEFNGREYGGSGILVGPHHFLTAGHCVYEPETSTLAENIRVYLALNGEAAPFNEALGVRVYLYPQWVESKNSDFDIALIVLNRSLGYETGWAGLLCLEDEELADQTVHVTGYPGDKGFKTMWTMDQRLGRVEREQLSYTIDTNGGQSGGAVWIKKWGTPHVVGVHTSGGRSSNFGVRLSRSKIETITHQWIASTFEILSGAGAGAGSGRASGDPRPSSAASTGAGRGGYSVVGGGGSGAAAVARPMRSAIPDGDPRPSSAGSTGSGSTSSGSTSSGRDGYSVVVGGGGAGAAAVDRPMGSAIPDGDPRPSSAGSTGSGSTSSGRDGYSVVGGGGAGAGSGSVPRPIPDIARGHEEIYQRFIRGKLVYKPNKDGRGMVEVPISSLINPLEGTFDLSAFGDTSRYISIHTGYKRGKIPANDGKLEIWACPKFLGATAPQFAGIMSQWESPIAYFWTWGGHAVATDNFDYLLKTDVCMNNELNCYEKRLHRSRDVVHPLVSTSLKQTSFHFKF
jgi:V8-like Glu-specific endopeptidase